MSLQLTIRLFRDMQNEQEQQGRLAHAEVYATVARLFETVAQDIAIERQEALDPAHLESWAKAASVLDLPTGREADLRTRAW